MTETSFVDILKRPFHWPALGGKLWREANPSQGGGQLSHRSWDRLIHMAVGYKEGADILAEEFKREYKHQATLVYPPSFSTDTTLKYSLIIFCSLTGQMRAFPQIGKPAILQFSGVTFG